MLRLSLIALCATIAPALAQIDSAPKVHARLIAERDAVKPGGSVTVALELATRPGWHTYWQNPGECRRADRDQMGRCRRAGRRAPSNGPAPQAEAVGPLMDYGYEGKPWLLVDITAPNDASAGTATLKAQASWLVCAEVCVPEDATVSLALNVGEASLPPDPDFAAARAKLPIVSPWPMRYAAGAALDLFVQATPLATAHPVKAEFFPLKPGMVNGIARRSWASPATASCCACRRARR